MPDKDNPVNRRNFVKSTGAMVAAASFAGCIGDDDDGDDTATDPVDDDDLASVNGFEVPDEHVVPAGELDAAQEIHELEMIVEPPEANPRDFEACNAFAESVSELGLDIEVNSMTWSAVSDEVWWGRDWDMTFWEMVGRASRLDPDEFLFQMFHTDRMDGYNYYFWDGGEDYNDLVETQRRTPDPDERRGYVMECQELIHERGPSTFIMYPELTIAWNADKWDGLVDMDGMGVRNPVSFREMQPLTDDEQLVLSYDTEIQTINPFNQSGEVDMIQHRMLWDRLVMPDADANPAPAFAEEITWVDDTTVEVPFKQGHEFHDGTEVLAEDVKFSFDAHDPEYENGYDTWFTAAVDPIESVEIDDDYRVTFNLESPFAPFELATLHRVAIIPRNYWVEIFETMDEENPMDHQEEEPLGSGPLEFVHWRRDDEVRLDRYDDHFDPVDYESRVTRIIPDTSAILAELESEGVDMLGDYGGDPDVLSDIVEENDHLEMSATVSCGFKQFSYNHETAPFHIAEFRRALHHQVPKDVIVDQIYGGWGAKAPNTPVSSVLDQWHNDELEEYETDIQAAANELVEAGFVWDEDGILYMPEGNTEAPQYD